MIFHPHLLLYQDLLLFVAWSPYLTSRIQNSTSSPLLSSLKDEQHEEWSQVSCWLIRMWRNKRRSFASFTITNNPLMTTCVPLHHHHFSGWGEREREKGWIRIWRRVMLSTVISLFLLLMMWQIPHPITRCKFWNDIIKMRKSGDGIHPFPFEYL